MMPMNNALSHLQFSPIRAYTDLARRTPGCAMLTIGEPDFATPQPIKDGAVEALHRDRTHYAPNQGELTLRQAIGDYETSRGNPTAPGEVLVTVGATQALFTALLGILNPGDEIILPTPCFNLYENIAAIAGAKVVRLDISKTGFQIDEAALNAAITPKTRAILINSPCNPTGTVFSAESLAAVKRAILGKPIFLIWDGVYGQLSYVPCPDLTLDRELKSQTILCQSFSKPWAMTGWRLGYLCCPADVMERLLLLSAYTITAVPTFLQDGALAALGVDPAPMKEIYRQRRDYVCGRLTEMGLSFPEPEGAFYVFPDIRKYGMTSERFCTRMIREGKLAAVPGSCFGTEGHIRLSYCYRQQELETGLDRLAAFLQLLESEG